MEGGMKRIVNTGLSALLGLSVLAGCSSEKTYTGKANGFGGEILVEISVWDLTLSESSKLSNLKTENYGLQMICHPFLHVILMQYLLQVME